MANTLPNANSFQKATDGDLVGYPTVTVDIPYLLRLMALCVAAVVTYLMGGKAHDLMAVPLDVRQIDCSGFARWLLYHATRGALLLPDGSCIEDQALALDGFKRSDPANCALHDGHVRVCIHLADDKDGTGHIWIVLNGVTYESHGGRGVSSRAWNVKLSSGYRLDELATHCFVLC